ncbi:MAG: AMP-binding protein, partial [Singulisphaera sp.]|nr:AMP-binding protein [Singulisphaera sp.]
VQVIAPSLTLPLSVIDLSTLPEAQREAEARRHMHEEARRPFDLARGPLLHLGLIRLHEREQIALVALHHIVCDAWSLGILARELAALYYTATRGLPSPLPELPLHYADYAAWQRQWLRGEPLQAQLDYWKGRLASVPALELPTDRPRPAAPSFRGGSRTRVLPQALLAQAHALSRQEGASLFMTLLAAFQALLHRYSGQDDIAVGTPIAGRNRSELEGIVGFFVNTLVLRADLSGDPGFREVLRRVKHVALEAYAHQDVSFEQVVEAVQPDRDLSRAPLFQAMFALQNAPPLSPQRLPELEIIPLGVGSGTAKFDLTLFATETAEGLEVALEFSADLFDAATIDRMLGHYQTLLEAIVTTPDRRISGLALIGEDERRRILVDWSTTAAGSPPEGPVHRLFEAQAARTPGAVAVAFEDRRLTYGELNAWANRLAYRLRARGVGPEVRVGLFMERSPELIAGLLGVLKAGGAYVPLDPSNPGDRLGGLLSDSGIRVLLTESALLERLPPHAAEVLCLDGDGAACASEPDHDLEVGAALDDLAYVIYTSGSTGRPKGVLVSHRNLAHSTHARLRYYREPVAGFLLVSSLAFDSSVAGLFWTLAQGGTLVLPRQGEQGDPARLARLIQEHRLSHVLSVPSLFALLLSEAPAARGGGALPRRRRGGVRVGARSRPGGRGSAGRP